MLTKIGAPPFAPYAAKPPSMGAGFYYRVFTPLKTLELLGLVEPVFWDDTRLSNPDRENALRGSDLLLYWQSLSDDVIQLVGDLKKLGRPVILYDCDDYTEYIHPANPRYGALGTRLPNGEKVRPGERILNTDGQVMWADQTSPAENTFFDVRRNHRRIAAMKRLARLCTGVTVSTVELRKVFLKYGCKKVYVYPNSIREADYPRFKVERSNEYVDILWPGGWSHYRDWEDLGEALKNVFRRCPNARLTFWGQEFPAIKRALPADRYRYLDWLPYEKYTLRLGTIGAHIMLAPLHMPDRFNNCKSNIKWLEGSALHQPMATLARKSPPYAAINHGETGLLYDSPQEFEDMLVDLINDAAQRERLAAQAHEAVWDQYNAIHTARPLLEWYEGLRDAQPRKRRSA